GEGAYILFVPERSPCKNGVPDGVPEVAKVGSAAAPSAFRSGRRSAGQDPPLQPPSPVRYLLPQGGRFVTFLDDQGTATNAVTLHRNRDGAQRAPGFGGGRRLFVRRAPLDLQTWAGESGYVPFGD